MADSQALGGTPERLLADLLVDGGVRLQTDRRGLLHATAARGAIVPLSLFSLISHHEGELVRLLRWVHRYRRLLPMVFRSRAGLHVPREERLRSECARIIDELGPVLASTVYNVSARRWTKRKSCCAHCGGGQEYHEPPFSCPRAGKLEQA